MSDAVVDGTHASSAIDGNSLLDDPTEYLKRKPKKSILKMKQDSSMDDSKDGRAHFDEMNILATYHPADKDYGTMKIDEPKTPYNHSDPESEADDAASVCSSSSRTRRVSLGTVINPEQIAAGLASSAGAKLASAENSDDEADEHLSEEQKTHKREFEKKRKMHYNEGAALKAHLAAAAAEDEEDDDGDSKMH